jgi:UDP-N-acetylglucosamine--N-acetylmuramyl-(pentapeptide) pyrophosphoryl-undecaprenol N-acetylglucosamine transferase
MSVTHIVFTGGGSSGHVTPNLALIEKTKQQNLNVAYIGAKGIEKKIITQAHIPYYQIRSGKLRREFSLKNLIDPFNVLWGIVQSFFILGKLKPKIVFSKGGFVAVPVVIAAYLRRIPVVVHESDFSPGLANRLSLPFAKKICVNYLETQKFIKDKTKVIITGSPIRPEFFNGDRQKGLALLNFNEKKPLLLIIGGGLGSEFLNQLIYTILPALCEHFYVVHLTGIGKLHKPMIHEHYQAYEYLHDEIFDIMAAADLVVSRAGANSVYELLVLQKLNILIPLSKKASRGDQLENAAYAEKNGFSKVLQEEVLTPNLLLENIENIYKNSGPYREALKNFHYENAIEKIWDVMKSVASL